MIRRLRDDAPPRAQAQGQGLGEHEWLLSDLARHLEMPETTLYTWIRRGWVTARRHGIPPRWIIKADPADVAELRQRRSRPHGYYTRLRWTDPASSDSEGPGPHANAHL